MFRLNFIVSAAVLALTVPGVQALAAAQPQSSMQTAPPVSTANGQKSHKLQPITVHGYRLTLPIELQLFKKALTRSWSNNPADTNQLVCRWRMRTGTHLQTLFCETNGMYMRQMSQTQMELFLAAADGAGSGHGLSANSRIPVAMASLTFHNRIPRSTLAPLLRKLPPADASYTLRINGDNGKPILEYVLKNGNLVHIYEFVYKKGKPKSH